eukprot:TRINITY_DN103237_c0_g1_i1.p1 TRINITY_DN103237_c0_g1~~TRINITY_DN103237_c0_g1_i1.p1  ORF type:complete len:683 (-),score=134.63 TRINITY_DN103237_c0_g1_i1:361-2409(-)
MAVAAPPLVVGAQAARLGAAQDVVAAAPRCRSSLRRQPAPSRDLLKQFCALGVTGVSLRRLLRSCRRQRPQTFRINLQKRGPDTLQQLQDEGVQPWPLPWCRSGFSSGAASDMGSLEDTRPCLTGEIQIQEAPSMLPVEALDVAMDFASASVDSAVLDMCAGSGSQTAQLGDIVARGSSTLIVANEPDAEAAAELRLNVVRAGVGAAIFTNLRGQAFRRLAPESFEAVLVDAPCSCMGQSCLDSETKTMVDEQRQLLRSAWRVLKPGGVLLYSTSTLSRAENEEQCEWLLSEVPDARTIPLPLLLGIAAEDQRFVRIWPHLFDTSSFFMCGFQKRRPSQRGGAKKTKSASAQRGGKGEATVPNLRPIAQSEATRWMKHLAERYGFSLKKGVSPSTQLQIDRNGSIWLVPYIPENLQSVVDKSIRPGVKLLKKTADGRVKANRDWFLFAGDRATRQVPETSEEWMTLVDWARRAYMRNLSGAADPQNDLSADEGVEDSAPSATTEENRSSQVDRFSLQTQELAERSDEPTAGPQQDEQSYFTLMKGHIRANDLPAMQACYQTMRSTGVSASTEFYAKLISELGRAPDAGVSTTKALLADMREANLQPDLKMYEEGLFMPQLNVGYVEGAFEALKEAEAAGLPSTQAMYERLLQACRDMLADDIVEDIVTHMQDRGYSNSSAAP